jgi:hypothetical protein
MDIEGCGRSIRKKDEPFQPLPPRQLRTDDPDEIRLVENYRASKFFGTQNMISSSDQAEMELYHIPNISEDYSVMNGINREMRGNEPSSGTVEPVFDDKEFLLEIPAPYGLQGADGDWNGYEVAWSYSPDAPVA